MTEPTSESMSSDEGVFYTVTVICFGCEHTWVAVIGPLRWDDPLPRLQCPRCGQMKGEPKFV